MRKRKKKKKEEGGGKTRRGRGGGGGGGGITPGKNQYRVPSLKPSMSVGVGVANLSTNHKAPTPSLGWGGGERTDEGRIEGKKVARFVQGEN